MAVLGLDLLMSSIPDPMAVTFIDVFPGGKQTSLQNRSLKASPQFEQRSNTIMSSFETNKQTGFQAYF